MKKILIVEDEKVLAEMYKDKFEEAGFKINLVSSAKGAMELLKNEKPDLILLDILLGKESGITLLRQIKKTKDFFNIPVIAFSNYDDPQAKKETAELGAKAYLLKTKYTPKELLEEIKKFF